MREQTWRRPRREGKSNVCVRTGRTGRRGGAAEEARSLGRDSACSADRPRAHPQRFGGVRRRAAAARVGGRGGQPGARRHLRQGRPIPCRTRLPDRVRHPGDPGGRAGHAGGPGRGRLGGAPPPEDPNLAGWFTGAVSPGEKGTAVVVGHVDNQQGPAVFYGLGALKKGNRVEVMRKDGKTADIRDLRHRGVREEQFPRRPCLRLQGRARIAGHHLRRRFLQAERLRRERRRLRPPGRGSLSVPRPGGRCGPVRCTAVAGR